MGIIDNNWGGTPAEAWVSRAGLAKLPAYRDRTNPEYMDPAKLEALMAENTLNTEEKYRRLESREAAIRNVRPRRASRKPRRMVASSVSSKARTQRRSITSKVVGLSSRDG